MFKNYINITFRNLKKYKGFSFINILGLAVGMTCTLLILLWVQDELSYDRFFPNSNRLYRVVDSEKYSNGEESLFSLNPPSLAPALINQYPEIVDAARLRTVKSSVIQFSSKRFTENNLTFVDPSFLKMFGLPFLHGDRNNALSDISSVVLTQKMAEKYFSNENPIGKTIRIDNRFNFTVTGVIKNIPSNSHLKIDFLFPFKAIKDFGFTLEGWNSFAHTTYVLLAKGADYNTVSKKIKNKEVGEWIYWYKDGILKKKCNFKDSKLVGNYTEYHPNGKLACEYHYKNGKQEGRNKAYSITGELISDVNIVNGKQVGKRLTWYRQEREKDGYLTEIEYTDTSGNGYCIEWDNRHQKRSEGNYKNWQKDGIWTFYPYKNKALYENGRWVKQILENK